MKFTIDRSTWLRGQNAWLNFSNNSSLLRSYDQKKCCLGFFCLAVAYDSEQITDVASPADLERDERLPSWCSDESDGSILFKIMKINDDASLSDEKRENKLKELFASVGVTVEFVD